MAAVSANRPLVLGIGNLLLGDEGVGVHAVRAIQAEPWAAAAEVLEVGTAILEALPFLEAAPRLVLIDAMQGEGPPGSVYRVPLEDCRGPAGISSLHGFDLPRVLHLAGRRDRPPAVVIGVEPHRLGWSLDLSPAVAAALPAVLQAVHRELAVQ